MFISSGFGDFQLLEDGGPSLVGTQTSVCMMLPQDGVHACASVKDRCLALLVRRL